MTASGFIKCFEWQHTFLILQDQRDSTRSNLIVIMSSHKKLMFRMSKNKTLFKITSDFVVKDLPTNGLASLGTRTSPYGTMAKSVYCKYAGSGLKSTVMYLVLCKISRVCRCGIAINHGNPNGCVQNDYIITHSTHCGRDKMASILQTTVSNSFSWLQHNVCI